MTIGAIGVSGPVTREGADGPARPKVWEHARSQGREGRISIFIFLIESQSFVSIYLPEWRDGEPGYSWYLPLSLKLLEL